MPFELTQSSSPTSRFLPTNRRTSWRPLTQQVPTQSFAQVLAKQPGPRTAPVKAASAGTITPLPNPTGRLSGDPPYAELIASASRQYGVDPALIAGVIESESSFNPKAVSRAGAKGLMQLMDATAQGLGVTDSLDPKQNVMGGTRLLRQLLDRYSGDVKLALAAYNAGPGAVNQHGGVPTYAETQRYVPKVLSAMQRYAPTNVQSVQAVPQRSEQWR
ncbi:MAG: lytic transglycosylase domain-containing protein [Chloroflexota bacterium]